MGGVPYRSLTTLTQCKDACVADHRCVAVDWNSRPLLGFASCWLHFNAEKIRKHYGYDAATQYELVDRCISTTTAPSTTTTATGQLVFSRKLPVHCKLRLLS